MEIYRLKEEILERNALSREEVLEEKALSRLTKSGKSGIIRGEIASGVDDKGGLRITALKQGVKNPNRVNVYVDGRFEFSWSLSNQY